MLEPDGRLVIGPGDALAAVLPGQRNRGFGVQFPAGIYQGSAVRGGDFPVLAMLTLKVTAQGAQGKALRPRVEVEQRLFFDGVDGDGGYPGVVQVEQGAVLVLVHPARAELPGINQNQDGPLFNLNYA